VHFSAILYELAPMLSGDYFEHPKSKRRTERDARSADFVFEKLVIFSNHDLVQVPGDGWNLALDFQQPDHIFNETRPQNSTRRGDRTQGGHKMGVTGFLENELLGQQLWHDNPAGLLSSGFRGSETSFVKIDDEMK
jgi:hypothetical protein